MACRVREHVLELLRERIAAALGNDPQSPVTDQLARFALAAIDGAFVASQTDRGATLEQLLWPLAPSLVATRRALLARSRAGRPVSVAGRRVKPRVGREAPLIRGEIASERLPALPGSLCPRITDDPGRPHASQRHPGWPVITRAPVAR